MQPNTTERAIGSHPQVMVPSRVLTRCRTTVAAPLPTDSNTLYRNRTTWRAHALTDPARVWRNVSMRHLPTRTTRTSPRGVIGALLAGLLCATGATVPAVADAPAPAPASAPRADNGLALTPPMGFNNWNSTHCRAEFNESMVKGIADIFVEKGLKDSRLSVRQSRRLLGKAAAQCGRKTGGRSAALPERHQGSRGLCPLQRPENRHLYQCRHQDLRQRGASGCARP